jgi:hypothetical protein
VNFIIFGNDKRYEYLAELLIKSGWKQNDRKSILDERADLLILSPKEDVFTYINAAKPGAFIFGGKNGTKQEIQAAGRMKFEQSNKYKIKNSIATAEGALCIAISETNRAIIDCDVLVLGYGFLGRETADLFSKTGATINVCTASETELKQAEKKGYHCILLKDLDALAYHIILNTIPAHVLDNEKFCLLPEGAILIELASKPCCDENQEAVRIIKAGALPGRFSPYSAALYMYEEITEKIWEENR